MIKGWIKFNESFNSNDIRVTEEEFLKKESKLERRKFSDKEIAEIKDITDKEESNIEECLCKLEPGYINHTIAFNTNLGSSYLIIIKFEDEWFLIEERSKRPTIDNKFFIADGFDQLCEYLKCYIIQYKTVDDGGA